MHHSPNNNFDFESNEHLEHQSLEPEFINHIDALSRKQVIRRRQSLKKLFIYLIGFGLGLGMILSVIVTIVLNKFGLLEKPYQNGDKSQPSNLFKFKDKDIEKQ